MEKLFEMVELLLSVEQRIKDKIETMENRLEELDTNNTGEVTIVLDEETGASFKFVKVLGSWGIMCDNGNWEDFKNVKEKYLNCFHEAIRKVLD